MAYSKRFYTEFIGTHNLFSYKLEIHLNNNPGGSYSIDLIAPDPVHTIGRGSKRDDRNKVIQGRELIFDFFSTVGDNNKYDEIFNSSFKDYIIFLYREGVLDFAGYVKPENLRREYIADQYYLSLSATDGLAELKEVEYPAVEGQASILSVVKTAIDQIGINLDFLIQLGTYESNLSNEFACALKTTNINVGRFINSKDGFTYNTDCYKVIESVLDDFDVILTQENGIYKITNPNEVTSHRFWFGWDALDEKSRVPYDLIRDLNWYEFFDKGQLNVIEPAKKARLIFQNRNVADNILPVTWTNSGGWDFFSGSPTGLSMSIITTVGSDGYEYGTSGPFYIEKKGDDDTFFLRFVRHIASLAPASGYEPAIKVQYKTALITDWTDATSLLLIDETKRYLEIADIPVDGTASTYQIRFGVLLVAGTTRLDTYITDMYGYPVYSDDDLTSDTLIEGIVNSASYNKVIERKSYFGDGLQSNDIGNFKIGSTLTAQWNRYGQTEDLPILQLHLQNIINNSSEYREYLKITVYDKYDLIRMNEILKLKTKYYLVVGFNKAYKSGTVSLDLDELISYNL